ncbi:hypothetical protein [Actinoalloteichus fjordicus]|uniref:hypothetical protein n=1 Tax=Actinoalloteichus fjordicus TaxID=1612552 RepID=UPI0012F7B623|nr:hypothetical protein [Actinoalloteichus fjordicus]
MPYFDEQNPRPVLSAWRQAEVQSILSNPDPRDFARPVSSEDALFLDLRPFLLSGEEAVLAGVFRRHAGGMCWFLPKGCPRPAAWVAVALTHFREVDPERIPALPRWWERPKWATADQRAARDVVADLEVERERMLDDLDRQLVEARDRVAVADTTAAEGLARLLSADGDALETAVRITFESFGFEV